jgi:O-antigen/teichoic acid export membrane protein
MLPPRLSARLTALRETSVLHNLGGAAGIQLSLLVSGSLSARLLGPENRGYLAILVAVPSAVGQLGAVGMSLAATYYLSSGAIGGTELIQLLRRPALIQFVSLTLINAAIVSAYTLITGAPIVLAMCISLAIMPAALCADYGFAFLLGARRHGTVNMIRILNPALTAAGIVPLYLLHDQSLAAVMAVSVGCSVIAGVLALQRGIVTATAIKVSKSLVARLGRLRAKQIVLAFGRQGYLGYLSPVDSFKLDQLAVGFLLSPRELGFYVVGAAFTNVGRLVATNLGLSATPEIAALNSDPDAQRQTVRHTLLLTGGILTALTIGLALFVIVAIPFFFGADYRPSIPVAEILLVACWMLSLKRIVVDVMRGIGETRVGTRPEMLNLGLFLAGVVPLGLWLGGRGVALALVIAASGGSALLIRGLLHTSPFSAPKTTSPKPSVSPEA